jgi:hypothetical protein
MLLCSVGCIADNSGDYASLNLDISRVGTLYLLLDSGADLSFLKSKNIFGISEFEPGNKVTVKSVDGPITKTRGRTEAKIKKGILKTPFSLKSLSNQIDVEGDVILGREFSRKCKHRFVINPKP